LTQSGAKVKASGKLLEIYRTLFCHARRSRITAQIEKNGLATDRALRTPEKPSLISTQFLEGPNGASRPPLLLSSRYKISIHTVVLSTLFFVLLKK
jgi:hypothetical protein